MVLSFPTLALFLTGLQALTSLPSTAAAAPEKVQLQLGVMSQCPDAILCRGIFDQVLERVGNITDFSLIYVASLNATDSTFGATCKHGALECAGNVQQLCAAKYAQSGDDTLDWWRFVGCQNDQGKYVIGNPDVAFKCAEAAGIDWETSGVGQCAGLEDASGQTEEGIKLFHESITLGKSLGIEKSCSILISGVKVCVHDGTWKQCENGYEVEDFVRQIEAEYSRINA